MRLSSLSAFGALESPLQFFVWSSRSYSRNTVPPGPVGSRELVPTSNTEQPQAQASAGDAAEVTRIPHKTAGANGAPTRRNMKLFPFGSGRNMSGDYTMLGCNAMTHR